MGNQVTSSIHSTSVTNADSDTFRNASSSNTTTNSNTNPDAAQNSSLANNNQQDGGQNQDLTPLDIVKLKLSSLNYHKQLNPKDFDELAFILSDKDALMRTYLHTDFERARELQQRVLNGDQDGNNSSATTSTATETNNSHHVTNSSQDEEDEDAQNLSLIYDQLRNGSLRIKLIVAETSRNIVERNLKRLASPLINLALENPPEFGLFHIALTIGCWKIEWNNSSLCIPRAITGKSAIIAADIESIATSEHLDTVREKLADIIVRWNTSMYYQQNPGKDCSNKGNCQQFIDDVLDALDLSSTVKKFPKPLMNYLRVLRTQGMARMEFDMSKEFRQEFDISEKKIIFKTHEQLDRFYAKLLDKNPDFQYAFKYEFYMLKAFDRAFWMRLRSRASDSFKKVCQPLYSEDGAMICPMGDPETTSILQFRVKR